MSESNTLLMKWQGLVEGALRGSFTYFVFRLIINKKQNVGR